MDTEDLLMPSGYTAGVADGSITDFPTFAMRCARAFGALVTMRDDPVDAQIPDEIEPAPYYDERCARLEAELATLLALTPGEAEERARQEYEGDLRIDAECAAHKAAVRQRYEAMLAEVRAWTPPTEDHEGMKAFMLEQLTGSIDFDCHEFPREPRKLLSGEEWLRLTVASTRRMLADAREQANEEALRAKRRTEWLRALRGSLNAEAR